MKAGGGVYRRNTAAESRRKAVAAWLMASMAHHGYHLNNQ